MTTGMWEPKTWEQKRAEELRLENLIEFRKAEILKLQSDIKFYTELKEMVWK